MAPVLYVQALIRHNASHQILAWRATPGARCSSAIKPETTPEAPADGVQLWMGGYHIFDVAMISTERAGDGCALLDIIWRRCYKLDPILVCTCTPPLITGNNANSPCSCYPDSLPALFHANGMGFQNLNDTDRYLLVFRRKNKNDTI